MRIAWIWVWVGVGTLLAYSSYRSFAAGFGALLFAIVFVFYGLRRLRNVSGIRNVALKRVAVVLFSVGISVIGMHGYVTFVRKHEANFAPLIAALERYRDATGEYPDNLDELVPEFVTSLPECPVRADWAGDNYYSKRKEGKGLQGTYIIQCAVGAFIFPQLGIYESDAPGWTYTD